MSFAALAWAAKQRPGNLAAKMVLLGLANFADEHGCAYPSTAALAEFGDMNHKTVTTSLDRLVEMSMIEDSGEREGRTKQIKVYRLKLESLPKTEASLKRKPPVSSSKDPQKRVTDTVRTSSSQKAKKLPSRKPTRKPATPIPENFMPVMSGKTASVVAGWPPGRFDDELEQFCDYHTAHGTLSHDWQASWRTWVRNSKRWEPRNGHGRRSGTTDHPHGRTGAAVESVLARIEGSQH